MYTHEQKFMESFSIKLPAVIVQWPEAMST